jgi:protein involved in polysaccharide export with SLBB domain
MRRPLPFRLLFAALLVLWAAALPARAQTDGQRAQYRVGSGDVLQLNVLENPSLDRKLTVQSDGSVFIPQVGEVSVSGLTIGEIEALIRQRLRLFDPSIEEIKVQVVEYNALRIYILGAVANPGPYTFTSTPTFWDLIRAAGGALDNAYLAQTKLVRQVNGTSRSQIVDLSGLLTGEMTTDVVLKSGDTVIIPTAGATVTAGAMVEGGVQILGAVGNQMVVPLDGPTRLVTCLMMAGAIQSNTLVDQIWWVHHEGGDQYVARHVDLTDFFKKGDLAGNPLVYPGDAIQVEYDLPSWWQQNLPLIFGAISSISTAYLLFKSLGSD